jgi:hypothetical protein
MAERGQGRDGGEDQTGKTSHTVGSNALQAPRVALWDMI